MLCQSNGEDVQVKRPELISETKNCSVSAKVECKLKKDNSNCEDIIVQPGECGVIPVQFKFKYCNKNEDVTLEFKKQKTVGKIYNKKVSVNRSPLPPLKCRIKKVDYNVDTCKKSRIHSQLKIEAKIPIAGDDYCYAFFFYSRKIKKLQAVEIPVPTLSPVQIPPPKVNLTLECYVETIPGSGVFDKECEDIGEPDFQATPVNSRSLQDTSNIPQDDKYHKTFMFVYKLANKSDEDIFVDNVTVHFNDEDFVLLPKGDSLIISPFHEYTSEGQIFEVELFAGDYITISGEATALESRSNQSIGVLSDKSIPLAVPNQV
jgi:hypothetical protein